jgi:hypothetical protein
VEAVNQPGVLVVTASADDILRAAKALFECRKARVTDVDPKHRHPMTYASYKWADLPRSEKEYYCDMAAEAFQSYGVTVPTMPTFEALHA